MKLTQVTGFVVTLSVVGLLVYDGFAMYFGGLESTVSAFLWKATDYKFLTFLIGCVCGHVFWPREVKSSY